MARGPEDEDRMFLLNNGVYLRVQTASQLRLTTSTNTHDVLVGNLKERGHLDDPGKDGRRILKGSSARVCTGLVWF